MTSSIRDSARAAILAAAAAIALSTLVACGGGGGNETVGGGSSGGGMPDGETVLEKHNRFLGGAHQPSSWPKFGEYTHTLFHLLGNPVGGGNYALQPFNGPPCQQENCYWDRVSLEESNLIKSFSHVMDHADISVYRAQGKSSLFSSFETYGAWLEFTAFTVQRTCEFNSECERRGGFNGSIVSVDGKPSNSNPNAGPATWIGAVTAADTVTHNVILGDARITINDFFVPNVDVSLTGLWDVTEGIKRNDISWHNLPLIDAVTVSGGDVGFVGGAFSAGSAPPGTLGPGGNFVYGQFYGPAHQEVAGRFEHPATRTRGAFGAKRQ